MSSTAHLAPLAQRLRALAAQQPEAAKAWIRSLPPASQLALKYTWPLWARPEQLPPEGAEVLYQAGRGWGKTRTGSEIVRAWREQGVREMALVGGTAADVRDTMVLGPSGVLAICPPWDVPRYVKSERSIYWEATKARPWRTRLLCYSAEKPDGIRGPNLERAWVDEPGKMRLLDEVLSNLRFAVRIGESPQIIYTTTPKRTPAFAALAATPDLRIIRGTTLDNAANLSRSAVAAMYDRYGGTRTGRQELEGELLSDVEGALWKRDWVERHRTEKQQLYYVDGRVVRRSGGQVHKAMPSPEHARAELEEMREAGLVDVWFVWDEARRLYRPVPAMVRVVVGVDPSGSSRGAHCGIVAVGLGEDGHLYLLEDASVQGSPARWAAEVNNCFQRHKADIIIAEINFGGEMVESTLAASGGDLPVKVTTSSKGKYIRAEPVALMAEKGKLHHHAACPHLEDQMTTWLPGDKKSPDRLDACVFACLELMDLGSIPLVV